MQKIVSGFSDLDLGLTEPLFNNISDVQQHTLKDALEDQKEKREELTKSFQWIDESTMKKEVLDFMQKSTQEIKDVIRELVLQSPAMHSLETVNKAMESETFKQCDFNLDASVRRIFLLHMEQMVKYFSERRNLI